MNSWSSSASLLSDDIKDMSHHIWFSIHNRFVPHAFQPPIALFSVPSKPSLQPPGDLFRNSCKSRARLLVARTWQRINVCFSCTVELGAQVLEPQMPRLIPVFHSLGSCEFSSQASVLPSPLLWKEHSHAPYSQKSWGLKHFPIKTFRLEAGRMTQWVNCSLKEHEDLSSAAWHPCKTQSCNHIPNPHCWGRGWQIPRACWTAAMDIVKTGSSTFGERETLSQIQSEAWQRKMTPHPVHRHKPKVWFRKLSETHTSRTLYCS